MLESKSWTAVLTPFAAPSNTTQAKTALFRGFQGNTYYGNDQFTSTHQYASDRNPDIPDHPNLSAWQAHNICIVAFPLGRMYVGGSGGGLQIGTDAGELLPGTYRYQSEHGDDRVDRGCTVLHNMRRMEGDAPAQVIDLVYGEPFQFTFFAYHGRVMIFQGCSGGLHRVGD